MEEIRERLTRKRKKNEQCPFSCYSLCVLLNINAGNVSCQYLNDNSKIALNTYLAQASKRFVFNSFSPIYQYIIILFLLT